MVLVAHISVNTVFTFVHFALIDLTAFAYIITTCSMVTLPVGQQFAFSSVAVVCAYLYCYLNI